MAGHSPFLVFRKYRKKLLAGLGIFTIFAFIVFPILSQVLSSGGGVTHAPYIASTRAYGKFVYSTRESEQRAASDLARFYSYIRNDFIQNEIIAYDPDFQAEVFKGSKTRALLRDEIQRLDVILPEVALVNKWLLINYAEEQGVSVSKQMVEEHLRLMTDGQLSNEGLVNALKEVGMTSSHLEYLVRRELTFIFAQRMFLAANPDNAPISMRWDWFQRVNRRVTAEVAVLNLDNYLSKVKDPGEAELKDFFEANKDRVYNPFRPESGFRIPKKVAFQLVLREFSEEFLDTITEEEVKAYYEEHKETFIEKKPVLPTGMDGLPFLGPPGMGTDSPPEGAETEKPADSTDTPPAETPDTQESGETAPETPVDGVETTEPPEKQDEPGDSATENTETAPEATAPEAVADEAVEEKEEQPTETEPSNFSGLESASIPTRLVAYQVDEEIETPATETGPSLDAIPGAEKIHSPELPETPNTVTESEETVPATPVVPGSSTVQPVVPGLGDGSGSLMRDITHGLGFPGVGGGDSLLGGDLDMTLGTLGEGLVTYKPLTEVEPEIRRLIAKQKADSGLEEFETAMNDFMLAFRKYTANPDKNPQPKSVDLEALSKKYGNIVLTSPAITYYEAVESPLFEKISGNNAEAVFNMLYGDSTTNRYTPFDIFSFGELAQYASMFASYAKDNREGIAWITDFSEEKEPKFEDAKDVVTRRWKEVNAREFALKDAEKIREIANSASAENAGLANAVKGVQNVHLVVTNPFTWVTPVPSPNMNFRNFRIGNVTEKRPMEELLSSDLKNKWIHYTGSDFMKTAYSLKIGRSGVSKNNPENEFYVIRVTDSSPSDELLNRQFLNAAPGTYLNAGAGDYENDYARKQLKRIREHAELKWGDAIDKKLIPVD